MRYSLFAIHYSLFTIAPSDTIHYSLFTIRYSLFAIHYSPIRRYSLFAIRYSLFPIPYSLTFAQSIGSFPNPFKKWLARLKWLQPKNPV
ncbi:MAG: hypothetical protein FWD58_08055 [Firmicutes bacterium]|nr:hypothetical protein [Bacillota bacterium]